MTGSPRAGGYGFNASAVENVAKQHNKFHVLCQIFYPHAMNQTADIR